MQFTVLFHKINRVLNHILMFQPDFMEYDSGGNDTLEKACNMQLRNFYTI